MSVNVAMEWILELGPGTQLAKVDIKHTYRSVPINPDERHLLGMTWRGHLFVDKTPPWVAFCPKDLHRSGRCT